MPDVPKAAVFDIGRVLYDWNLRYLFEKLIDDSAELDHFLATVITEEWHFQSDAGRPLAQMVPELKAYAAYVLARAAAADARPEQDGFDGKALMNELWGRRSDMSPYGQAWLMLALHTTSDARAGEQTAAISPPI